MCNKLVVIACRLTPPEAELLRVQLAVYGLRSWLENADFITWFWHLSNAAGGVKLLVQSTDVQQAYDILNSTPESVAIDEPPPQPCQKCNEPFPPTWHLCWKCGTAADGTEDPEFFYDKALPIDALGQVRQIPAIGVLFILIVVLMMLMPSLFILIALYWTFRPDRFIEQQEGEREKDSESRGGALYPDDPDSAEAVDPRTDAGDELCTRAMRSAVIGFCYAFPFCFPWVLYSLWVLLIVDLQETPVSDSGRRSYYQAWVLNTIFAVIVVVFFAIVLIV